MFFHRLRLVHYHGYRRCKKSFLLRCSRLTLRNLYFVARLQAFVCVVNKFFRRRILRIVIGVHYYQLLVLECHPQPTSTFYNPFIPFTLLFSNLACRVPPAVFPSPPSALPVRRVPIVDRFLWPIRQGRLILVCRALCRNLRQTICRRCHTGGRRVRLCRRHQSGGGGQRSKNSYVNAFLRIV